MTASQHWKGHRVLIPRADEQRIRRPSAGIELFDDAVEPVSGLTLARIGGHFDGGNLVHVGVEIDRRHPASAQPARRKRHASTCRSVEVGLRKPLWRSQPAETARARQRVTLAIELHRQRMATRLRSIGRVPAIPIPRR